jgi:hypothetical protein
MYKLSGFRILDGFETLERATSNAKTWLTTAAQDGESQHGVLEKHLRATLGPRVFGNIRIEDLFALPAQIAHLAYLVLHNSGRIHENFSLPVVTYDERSVMSVPDMLRELVRDEARTYPVSATEVIPANSLATAMMMTISAFDATARFHQGLESLLHAGAAHLLYQLFRNGDGILSTAHRTFLLHYLAIPEDPDGSMGGFRNTKVTEPKEDQITFAKLDKLFSSALAGKSYLDMYPIYGKQMGFGKGVFASHPYIPQQEITGGYFSPFGDSGWVTRFNQRYHVEDTWSLDDQIEGVLEKTAPTNILTTGDLDGLAQVQWTMLNFGFNHFLTGDFPGVGLDFSIPQRGLLYTYFNSLTEREERGYDLDEYLVSRTLSGELTPGVTTPTGTTKISDLTFFINDINEDRTFSPSTQFTVKYVKSGSSTLSQRTVDMRQVFYDVDTVYKPVFSSFRKFSRASLYKEQPEAVAHVIRELGLTMRDAERSREIIKIQYNHWFIQNVYGQDIPYVDSMISGMTGLGV